MGIRLAVSGIEAAAYLVFSSISLLVGTWLLHVLFRMPSNSKKRIFWKQLCLLMLTQMACAFCGCALTVVALVQQEPAWTLCQAYVQGRSYLEFTSSIIEVHIAAGFCAACCHQATALALLSRSLPAVFLLSALLMPLSWLGDPPTVGGDIWGCLQAEPVWDYVVLLCCFTTCCLYVLGFSKTRGAPIRVRHRSLLAGCGYLISFLTTFGFQAGQDLFLALFEVSDSRVSLISQSLLCLNGAMNAFVYIVCTWRLLGAGFPVQFGHASEVQISIVSHFDLSLLPDGTTLEGSFFDDGDDGS